MPEERITEIAGSDPVGRALVFAARAHSGQTDKQGEPYLLHVLRVAGRCRTQPAIIAGLLHDVIEDGEEIGPGDLAAFSDRVIAAVELLTRRRGEEYVDYLDRLEQSRLAAQVKVCDLLDNLDPWRPGQVGADLSSLRARYVVAFKQLSWAASTGHQAEFLRIVRELEK